MLKLPGVAQIKLNEPTQVRQAVDIQGLAEQAELLILLVNKTNFHTNLLAVFVKLDEELTHIDIRN